MDNPKRIELEQFIDDVGVEDFCDTVADVLLEQSSDRRRVGEAPRLQYLATLFRDRNIDTRAVSLEAIPNLIRKIRREAGSYGLKQLKEALSTKRVEDVLTTLESKDSAP